MNVVVCLGLCISPARAFTPFLHFVLQARSSFCTCFSGCYGNEPPRVRGWDRGPPSAIGDTQDTSAHPCPWSPAQIPFSKTHDSGSTCPPSLSHRRKPVLQPGFRAHSPLGNGQSDGDKPTNSPSHVPRSDGPQTIPDSPMPRPDLDALCPQEAPKMEGLVSDINVTEPSFNLQPSHPNHDRGVAGHTCSLRGSHNSQCSQNTRLSSQGILRVIPCKSYRTAECEHQ